MIPCVGVIQNNYLPYWRKFRRICLLLINVYEHGTVSMLLTPQLSLIISEVHKNAHTLTHLYSHFFFNFDLKLG